MTRPDAVVIGGGIQGASAAYNLAKRGFGKVLVLERGAPAGLDGATGRSASMIIQQTGSPGLSALAKRSFEVLQSLSEELGQQIPFKQTGSILYGGDGADTSLSGPAESDLRRLLAKQVELGIATEWVAHERLEELSNGMLAGSAANCGIYCETDGYTDGTVVRDAYLSALRELDGEVAYGSEVIGLEIVGTQVRGVRLADGREISTSTVLNCAGIHASIVDRWAGVQLPLSIDQRFLAILKSPAGVPSKFPILEDLHREWYFRPDSRGVLMGVGPTQKLDIDKLPPVDTELGDDRTRLAREYMSRFVPRLAQSRVLEAWAGRRPLIDQATPEGLAAMPEIGRVGDLEGMYQSVGWGAFGITLAFVGGQLAADAICGELLAVEKQTSA
ncbi:MAG TPA: FAD-dependent oxidoreductase [Solirubrobacterales bacterium]|nr:FAD-dependent oxidoreductase [Solirubrobacterales bacterium]